MWLILERSTTWLAINMLDIPESTSTSASLSLAHVIPIAPYSICFFAMMRHLWVLKCGRSLADLCWKKLLINDKLNSNAGRSISKAGVGREYLGVLIGG